MSGIAGCSEALVALFWATLDLSVVVSPSMAPTLRGTAVANGDRVLTEKVTCRFRMPRRWEGIAYTTDATAVVRPIGYMVTFSGRWDSCP